MQINNKTKYVLMEAQKYDSKNKIFLICKVLHKGSPPHFSIYQRDNLPQKLDNRREEKGGKG